MENFKEVSLGFAEFVSQLIHETFEAILSAQNYQLEKYEELEKMLSLSNTAFKERYITEVQIKEKELDLFGFVITEHMIINEGLRDFLIEQFQNPSNFFSKNRLTTNGFNAVKSFVSDLLIEEKKSALNYLVNKSNSTNLVVDSGEICTKLELSNLYNYSDERENTDLQKTKETKVDIENLRSGFSKIDRVENFINKKVIKFSEIIAPESKQTTLLIDKSEIVNEAKTNFSIPSVRLVAQPVKMTSNSNLFTELKINFKTV